MKTCVQELEAFTIIVRHIDLWVTYLLVENSGNNYCTICTVKMTAPDIKCNNMDFQIDTNRCNENVKPAAAIKNTDYLHGGHDKEIRDEKFFS